MVKKVPKTIISMEKEKKYVVKWNIWLNQIVRFFKIGDQNGLKTKGFTIQLITSLIVQRSSL